MSTDEAERIAAWIVDTWPLTPKPRVWIDTLGKLDHGTAYATYRQLRRERSERSLMPAEFRETYEQLRPRPIEPSCPNCDGSGWVTVWQPGHTGTRLAKPCSCRAGDKPRRVQREIDEARVARQAVLGTDSQPPPLTLDVAAPALNAPKETD